MTEATPLKILILDPSTNASRFLSRRFQELGCDVANQHLPEEAIRAAYDRELKAKGKSG